MNDFENALEVIITEKSRYGRGAYLFLREALDYAQAEMVQTRGKAQHVTGKELLEGLRKLALQQFGPMAWTVLDDWGIRRCEDWGEIVFELIEHRVLSKTESDAKADFANGYSFEEAFRRPYQRPEGAR